MSSRETLEFIVKWLVDYPDETKVEETEESSSVVYDLIVHPDDVGKVIGKGGRTARALRTVVKAAAVKEKRNAIVEIAD